MNIDRKKINNIIILILVIAVVIVGGIFLMVLGRGKDDSLSLGTESEKIESELIESETLSTEDKGTELEESESSETEPPMTSEIETEEQQADAPEAEIKPEDGGNNSGNTGTGNGNTNTGNGNTGNSGSTNNSGSTGGNTGNNNSGSSSGNQGNTGNSGGGNISEIAPNIPQYDPMDANKDGWVDANEEMGYITPQKQKCIDAGYGVVVEQDGGKWYAILCKNGDQLFNGKMGNEVLREYLKERNLHADQITGCWINPDNEWYWYVAKDITEIPESGDNTGDIDWDDVNDKIEWND